MTTIHNQNQNQTVSVSFLQEKFCADIFAHIFKYVGKTSSAEAIQPFCQTYNEDSYTKYKNEERYMNLIPLIRYNAPTIHLSEQQHCDLIYCSYLITHNKTDERFFQKYRNEYKSLKKECSRVDYLPIQYKIPTFRNMFSSTNAEREKREAYNKNKYTNLMNPFNELTRNNKYMFIILYLMGKYLSSHQIEYVKEKGMIYDDDDDEEEVAFNDEFLQFSIRYDIIEIFQDTDHDTKKRIKKDIQNFLDLRFDGLFSYNYTEHGTDDNYINVYGSYIDHYIDDIDYCNIIGNGDEDSRYSFSG